MAFVEQIAAVLGLWSRAVAEIPWQRFADTTLDKVLMVGIPGYFLVLILERLCRTRTNVYWTKQFLHDLAYWFYSGSGIGGAITMWALLALIGPDNLVVFKLHLLTDLPFFWQAIAWVLVADFVSYWTHRLQHASPLFWAFHTTHHSQERVNLATGLRFHPVDIFVMNAAKIIPVTAMGADPMGWLPLYLTLELIATVQHSQISWKLGPVERIIATPRFHSFHHSVEPRHFNKNFGGILSIWDFMFGTATTAGPQPSAYGLTDVKSPTLLSTLYMPFVVLYRTYIRRAAPELGD